MDLVVNGIRTDTSEARILEYTPYLHALIFNGCPRNNWTPKLTRVPANDISCKMIVLLLWHCAGSAQVQICFLSVRSYTPRARERQRLKTNAKTQFAGHTNDQIRLSDEWRIKRITSCTVHTRFVQLSLPPVHNSGSVPRWSHSTCDIWLVRSEVEIRFLSNCNDTLNIREEWQCTARTNEATTVHIHSASVSTNIPPVFLTPTRIGGFGKISHTTLSCSRRWGSKQTLPESSKKDSNKLAHNDAGHSSTASPNFRRTTCSSSNGQAVRTCLRSPDKPTTESDSADLSTCDKSWRSPMRWTSSMTCCNTQQTRIVKIQTTCRARPRPRHRYRRRPQDDHQHLDGDCISSSPSNNEWDIHALSSHVPDSTPDFLGAARENTPEPQRARLHAK